MAERVRKSLSATQQGLESVHAKLKKFSSNKAFADLAGVSRATVQNFLVGKPLRVDSFRAICQTLELDWEEVAGLTTNSTSVENPQSQENNADAIAALVQEARQQIQPYIQERCGMMRVLDMEQPIELGDIYTSVNILERITGRRGLDISELMQNADPEQFDRFCLGKVQEKRVPGLEAVEKFSKLMILGKPGAGKTTFLKHLAMQSIGGKFQSDRVPIFITLKDFAEADDKPNLLTYIERLISLTIESDRPNASPLHNIVCSGKALILLDGLDEVREADSRRVLRQIREFSTHFCRNRFIITCRIAAQGYAFEQFTEVEVSDFDDKQIVDFVSKWFSRKNIVIKSEIFLQRIRENPLIRELTISPILLTLLCLVFEDLQNFPVRRTDLYERGIEILLRRWSLHVRERSSFYKLLSPDYREQLLICIAWETFQRGKYFFKEREITPLIQDYFKELPGISPNFLWQMDCQAILNSIQAQHGLLIERAVGIWSFSHLTFQEYFTAHAIVNNEDLEILDTWLENISSRRWYEVFSLTLEIALEAPNIERFLILLKSRTDNYIASNSEIQKFLEWVNLKSESIDFQPRHVTRASYFTEIHSTYRNLGIILAGGSIKLELEFGLDQLLTEILGFISDPSLENLVMKEDAILYHINSGCFNNAIDLACDLQFKQVLQNLKDQILNASKIKDSFKEWWKVNGKEWINNLRQAMIQRRSLGNEWNFSQQNQKFLEKYYYANLFLANCLTRSCRISPKVKREIEDTLLLPIAEIEKRKQQ